VHTHTSFRCLFIFHFFFTTRFRDLTPEVVVYVLLERVTRCIIILDGVRMLHCNNENIIIIIIIIIAYNYSLYVRLEQMPVYTTCALHTCFSNDLSFITSTPKILFIVGITVRSRTRYADHRRFLRTSASFKHIYIRIQYVNLRIKMNPQCSSPSQYYVVVVHVYYHW
jgi:hypothetical protein